MRRENLNFDLKDEYDLGLTERKCIQKEEHRLIELAAVTLWRDGVLIRVCPQYLAQ